MKYKERILIVDDDPVNAEMLQTFLEDDYHTRIANDGPVALTIAFSTPHPVMRFKSGSPVG